MNTSHRNTGKVYPSVCIFITLLFILIHGELKVTEIHYNPLAQDTIDGDEFEFIELKNTSSTPINLSNAAFTNGVDFGFAPGTSLKAGEFVVLASNAETFTNRYGFPPFAVYKGNFNNSGELITLKDTVLEKTFFSHAYKDELPWPITADGLGFSLVPKKGNPTTDPNDPEYWRASERIHGSPNSDDAGQNILGVLINEALTHTDTPTVDAIELYNPHGSKISLSGWYLTDSRKKPKKFRIPDNTIIESQGYIVFNENDFGSTFSLDSHGEEVYIFSASDKDSLTGYSHGFSFGEIENWMSFGRHITSTGKEHFVPQKEITLGKTNAGPRVGPLVISEIMYNPLNGHEYLEITNIGNEALRLYDPEIPQNTWRVDGVGFVFPENISIPIKGVILLISNSISVTAFKTIYNVPDNTQIFHQTGSLDDGGETITIKKPEDPYIDSSGSTVDTIIPFMDIDRVRYNDKKPWPIAPDGSGTALERRTLGGYGNDPVNWVSKNGTPGKVAILQPMKKNMGNAKQFFTLSANAPHSRTVAINISLTKKAHLTINLFTIQGKFIQTIWRGEKKSGFYRLEFEKNQFPSGVHFCRIKTDGGIVHVMKLLLAK